MLPQYLQGSADKDLLTYRIWQKRLYGRIGQWFEALYKTWNVVS